MKKFNFLQIVSSMIFFLPAFSMAGVLHTTGKLAEIRRESSSISASWTANYILFRVVESGISKWIRCDASAPAAKDYLAIGLSAVTTGSNVTVYYDDDLTGTGGLIQSVGPIYSLWISP